MEDETINQNYLIGCDTIENSPSQSYSVFVIFWHCLLDLLNLHLLLAHPLAPGGHHLHLHPLHHHPPPNSSYWAQWFHFLNHVPWPREIYHRVFSFLQDQAQARRKLTNIYNITTLPPQMGGKKVHNPSVRHGLRLQYLKVFWAGGFQIWFRYLKGGYLNTCFLNYNVEQCSDYSMSSFNTSNETDVTEASLEETVDHHLKPTDLR